MIGMIFKNPCRFGDESVINGCYINIVGSSINNHYGNNLATIFRNYGLVTLRIASIHGG